MCCSARVDEIIVQLMAELLNEYSTTDDFELVQRCLTKRTVRFVGGGKTCCWHDIISESCNSARRSVNPLPLRLATPRTALRFTRAPDHPEPAHPRSPFARLITSAPACSTSTTPPPCDHSSPPSPPISHPAHHFLRIPTTHPDMQPAHYLPARSPDIRLLQI
jgi:hypothetical protein